MDRKDDFAARRAHLAGLSDEQLKKRFWELADQIVKPLIQLAENHTSPAIERSVVMRMGFNTLETRAIVEKVMQAGLLKKGAGNVLYRLSQQKKITVKEAGKLVISGTDLSGLFEKEATHE